MGSLLQIRDVPDDARRALKARAAEQGESLNAYLLKLISREVSRPTVREVLERAVKRAEQGSSSSVEALQQSRRERDGQLGTRDQPGNRLG